uniref:Uncharacterized protein n=1 Tax=Lactuca sativa TaxID=4236 RepID=A0A9R1UU21_LACSA|nr:hypothetical protein LSAT_V11C800422270 [Lactuca sativa]
MGEHDGKERRRTPISALSHRYSLSHRHYPISLLLTGKERPTKPILTRNQQQPATHINTMLVVVRRRWLPIAVAGGDVRLNFPYRFVKCLASYIPIYFVQLFSDVGDLKRYLLKEGLDCFCCSNFANLRMHINCLKCFKELVNFNE